MLTRRIVHALATVAIAAATVLVLDQTGLRASHQFSDVGNGNFFHESIGAIGSAGCASGFNDGTFRPNSNPTRGQFAYWTNNCGSRIAYDRGVSFTVSGLNQLASVSVTAGALDNPPIDTGGYVWGTATAEASDGSNTTCEVAISMRSKRERHRLPRTEPHRFEHHELGEWFDHPRRGHRWRSDRHLRRPRLLHQLRRRIRWRGGRTHGDVRPLRRVRAGRWSRFFGRDRAARRGRTPGVTIVLAVELRALARFSTARTGCPPVNVGRAAMGPPGSVGGGSGSGGGLRRRRPRTTTGWGAASPSG